MFGNTSLAASAMLAPKRRAYHTRDAKIGLIEFPDCQKIVDDSPLFRNTIEFRNEPRIVSHARRVEKSRQSIKRGEHQIQYRMRPIALSGAPQDCTQPIDANEEERASENASHPGLYK